MKVYLLSHGLSFNPLFHFPFSFSLLLKGEKLVQKGVDGLSWLLITTKKQLLCFCILLYKRLDAFDNTAALACKHASVIANKHL